MHDETPLASSNAFAVDAIGSVRPGHGCGGGTGQLRVRRRSPLAAITLMLAVATVVLLAEHHDGDLQIAQGSIAIVVTEPSKVSPKLKPEFLKDLSGGKRLGPFKWLHDLSRVTVIKCGKTPLSCEAGQEDFPRGSKYTDVTIRVAGEYQSKPVTAEIVVTRPGGWFFGLGKKTQIALPLKWALSNEMEFAQKCPSGDERRQKAAADEPAGRGPFAGFSQSPPASQPAKPGTGAQTAQAPPSPDPSQARGKPHKTKYCVVPEPSLTNLRIVGVRVRDGSHVELDEDGTKTGDSYRIRFSEPGH